MEGDMITTGTPLVAPPLVDMISNDPILGDVKVAVIFYTYVLSPAITPPMLSQHSRSQALVKEERCDRRGEPTLNLAILIEMKPERKPLGA